MNNKSSKENYVHNFTHLDNCTTQHYNKQSKILANPCQLTQNEKASEENARKISNLTFYKFHTAQSITINTLFYYFLAISYITWVELVFSNKYILWTSEMTSMITSCSHSSKQAMVQRYSPFSKTLCTLMLYDTT